MTRPTALLLLLLLLAAVGTVLFWPSGAPETPPSPPIETQAAERQAQPTPVEAPVPPNGAGERKQPEEPVRTRVPSARSNRDAAQGVRGQVVDEHSRPIDGVQVSLLDSASNDPFGRFLNQSQSIPTLAAAAGETDAEGHFALGLREPSTRRFEVCLLADGFAAERLYDLAILEGEWTDLGTIQLNPGCTIRGRVTVAGTDLPVPQATVWLESGNPFVDLGPAHLDGWQDRRSANVGPDGRYELANAPQRGVYRLLASAPGFGRQIRDELDLQDRSVVEQDFALPRGLSISGRLDPGTRPLGAAKITVYPKAAEPAFFGAVGSDGRFYIHGLREGPHLLQIAAEGFQPLERDEVAAGTTDLVVALSPRGRAGVTVRDGSGTVLRRYRLAIRQWFEQNGGQIGMVRDVPDRVVHLDQDTSVAYVDGLDDGQFVFQVEAEGFASTLSPVLQLDATAREAIVEMSLARGGQFTGTVVDEAGRPVSGATVRTQPQGASEDNPVFRMLQSLVPDRITRKEAVTGGDGSFVLPGLSHANYQLEVVHGEFCRTVRRDLSLHEDRTETVPPIRLIRGALLRGRAVADGKPVPQAQIVLTPFAEPSPTDPSVPSAAGKSPDETSVARVEAVTNLDGSFELPRRVPAGTYELRGVSMVGQDPTADAFQKLVQMKRSTVRVEVRPGQLVVEQDLDLSR